MKKYRQHSEEFKREMVARIDSGEASAIQICREHNLAASMVDRWKQQIHQGTFKPRTTVREKQLERELEKYKAKVGELTLQVDLLKKLQADLTLSRRSAGYIVTGMTLNPSDKDAK
jgi:putative transposase